MKLMPRKGFKQQTAGASLIAATLLGLALTVPWGPVHAQRAGALVAAPPSVLDTRLKAADRLADVMTPAEPGQVRLEGYLGQAFQRNVENLLQADEEALLAPFRTRPSAGAHDGEPLGHWLRAASIAVATSPTPPLTEKLDRVIAELGKTQEADGYLGTYAPNQRFGRFQNADWDTWTHRVVLLGLLSSYIYRGDGQALGMAVKAGDLLVTTFGPSGKDVLQTGRQKGAAATALLEPMALLYRATNDGRYLDLCTRLFAADQSPDGPRTRHRIRRQRQALDPDEPGLEVLLANLTSYCEYSRTTGEQTGLTAARMAWDDLATGHTDFAGALPVPQRANARPGEAEAIMDGWVSLTLQLLRQTGDARYAEALEKVTYNVLAGSRAGDTGSLGMALAPTFAYLRYRNGREGVAVNLYDASRFALRLGEQDVAIQVRGESNGSRGYPSDADLRVLVETTQPANLELRLRSPAWATPGMRVALPGATTEEAFLAPAAGWATLTPPRPWQMGDTVQVSLPIGGRRVAGEGRMAQRATLFWGPLALLADESHTANVRSQVLPESAPALRPRSRFGFRFPTQLGGQPVILVPAYTQADAGARVWFGAPAGGAPDTLANRLKTARVEALAPAPGALQGAAGLADGSVLFGAAGAIYRLRPDRVRVAVERYLDVDPGDIYLRADDHLLVADNRLRAILDVDPDGTVSVVADSWRGQPLDRIASLTMDAEGNVYWTSPGEFRRGNPAGELFRLRPNGQVDRLGRRLGYPTGIGVDPSSKSLYVVEASASRVVRYELSEIKERDLGSPKVVYRLDGPDGGVGGGITFDAQGNLYLAHQDGARVTALSPKGDVLGHVLLGERRAAGVAFGGPRLDTLFVAANEPGAVLRVPIGTKGFLGFEGKPLRSLRVLPVRPLQTVAELEGP